MHTHRDTPQSKPTLCQPMGKNKRLIVVICCICIHVYTNKITCIFSVCRMYDHQEARITWQSIPVLFPDDLAAALYMKGESYFKRCFMPADDEPKKFWEHCKEHSPWFRTHPMKDFQRLDRLIPFTLYGDDVQCYKNSEVGTISVIGWTSDFAFLNGTLTRYFPICAWSEHCGTEFTHEDIMKHVTMRISRMVDAEFIHEWSEGGFAFIFHGISGDLKWIRDHFGLHKYNANECCSSCGAVKDHPDPSMTISDFRPTAHHVGTAPDLSSFHEISSVIFTLPGASPERVVHDPMHSQLLGTGKLSNGSGIIYLAESSWWHPFQPSGTYPDALEHALRLAHKDFLAWKKLTGLDVSQPRFTPARLSRKGRQNYACLSCKAAPSKAVAFWVAKRSSELASREGASEMDQLVATCLGTYAMSIELMDKAELIMSQLEAERFCELTLTHLQTYAVLNKRSRNLTGKTKGRNLWLIVPKHHHLFHCALRVKEQRINPKAAALFSGEDFVGRISRIARVCHRSTLSQRVLERYLALVHLELARLKL